MHNRDSSVLSSSVLMDWHLRLLLSLLVVFAAEGKPYYVQCFTRYAE